MKHSSRRSTIAIVGTCIATLFMAYVLLSGGVVDRVASATGAATKTSFNALWFADPSVASRPVPRGTPVRVVVANRTRGAQTVHWSTAGAGRILERGTIRLPQASTKTFVVQTRDTRPGDWFSVRLDGTPVKIQALIDS